MKQSTNPPVHILIPHYKAYEYSKNSIASLLKLTYPNFQIILIDDSSSDNSASRLQKIYPSIKVITTPKPVDYCRTFNLGIKVAMKAGAEYMFLVNNDTKNFSSNYLEEIIKTFQSDDHIGIAGSLCYDYNGKTRTSNIPKKKFGHVFNIPTEGFVVKREVFEKIGFLNERLIRYFEDIDLVVRARAAGYITKTVPSVSFDHLGQGTSSRKIFKPNYLRTRNLVLTIKRHCGNQTFKARLALLRSNVQPHLKQLSKSFYSADYSRFISILSAVVLGLAVGFLLPWKDNPRDHLR